MSIFANQGKDVLVGYNYMLRVEGIFDLPCKAVHSFTKENEFDFIQEGGINDYVHMLRKPISKPFTFTVERYVGSDPWPPLPLGAELVLPVILMVAPFPNRFDISKRTFVFTGCTVMGKTFGELNAEKSELLTETIVIGYREMVEVTIPVHIGEDADKWAFDGLKTEGNNVRSAQEYKRSPEDETPDRRYWSLSKAEEAKANTDQATSTEEKDPKNLMQTSATTLEATKAVRRSWLDTGTQSAAKLPGDTKPDEEDEEGAETGKNSRKWKMSDKDYKGEGIQSAKQAPETEAESRKWTMDGKGKPSAQTEPDTEAVPRSWMKDGTSSAKKLPLDETDTEEAEAKNGPRKWSMKDGGETSAKQAPETEAESRKWTMDGKGEASAQTEPDTEAVPRSWMKDGTSSAKKLPLDETDTGETEAKNGPRKWSMKDGGETSAKQAPETEAESRKWTMDGKGEASAQTEPDTEAVSRSWMKDGTSSAKKLPLDETDTGEAEAKNGPRKWSMKDGGETSAKQAPETEAESRKWTMNGGEPSAKTEAATEAEGRKWSMKDGGETSAKTEKATKAEGRKWSIEDGGETSAKTEKATKAESRKWSMEDGGETSAKTEKDTKAEGRKWSMEDGGETSAKTEKATKAEGRKWSIEDGGETSAKTEKDTKAEGRKWSIKDGGETSAKTEKDMDAEIRKWMLSAGGTTSAKTEPSSKPEQRKWPSISSAKKYEP